ncbi:MAG: sulfurtransferase [Cyanobacteria bacterium M_surface_10_m2_179]|nr:sulfurtransferase [Cyanobacteria bacterium M_surface_10_m2_179]
MSTPTPISARQLQQRLETGEPLQLVDVREAMELDLARLNTPVIHLPLSESERWIGTLRQILDAERDVVVLCHAGVRSWQFGCWLMEAQGFPRVWNLQGGIDAWSVEVDRSVPRY